MNPDALLLLTGYSVAILAAAMLGVWVQSRIRLTHTRMQLAMSFVAGLIIGVALYHLVPHSLVWISGPGAVEITVWWMVIGMILMLVLLRVFRFHQHDLGNEGDHNHGDEDGRATGTRSFNWLGICLGMGLHTLTEGVVLGASIRSDSHIGAEAGIVSLGIFLAILFHKPLDAFSILGLMRIAGIGHRTAIAVNLGIALVCPLAAFLTCWGIGLVGPAEGAAIGRALAFGAGVLLCVSLSDLLPELQFHGHDRFLLTAAYIAGIAMAYGLHYIESLPLPGLVR